MACKLEDDPFDGVVRPGCKEVMECLGVDVVGQRWNLLRPFPSDFRDCRNYCRTQRLVTLLIVIDSVEDPPSLILFSSPRQAPGRARVAGPNLFTPPSTASENRLWAHIGHLINIYRVTRADRVQVAVSPVTWTIRVHPDGIPQVSAGSPEFK